MVIGKATSNNNLLIACLFSTSLLLMYGYAICNTKSDNEHVLTGLAVVSREDILLRTFTDGSRANEMFIWVFQLSLKGNQWENTVSVLTIK